MRRNLFIFVLLCWSCQKKSESTSNKLTDQTVLKNEVGDASSSSLTFPLDFPIRDLSKVINRSLPPVLVEDTLQLKKKGYISLKIEPIGKALLASYGNNLDVSIPMKVSAEVEKKFLGLKVHKPISLKIRADMNTKLSIDQDWNLDADCRIQKIHWIEPPVIEVLGIKVNLQKKVDKKLAEKSNQIEEVVCTALQKIVPLKQQVTKIWSLIGKSHRVGKKPIDIWLTSEPTVFSAYFSKNVKDTLRVIVHTESDLFITPLSGLEHQMHVMPSNTSLRQDTENALDLNVDIYVPYDKMNEVLRSKLDQTTISYEGASITLMNFETGTAREKLHLRFDVIGDLEATIDAYAYPLLGSDHSLVIDEIEYEITSENSLVHLAEWVASDRLSAFLKENSQIPLAHVLDSLDHKIVTALNKSKAGGKVALEMDFDHLQSDTLVFTTSGMQWFFDVKGTAHAYLTEQLIQ